MESFRAVSAFMRAPVQLSHRQRVTRLYRASLRLLDSWAEGDRGTFVEGGAYIRGLFDENKHLDAEGGCVLSAPPRSRCPLSPGALAPPNSLLPPPSPSPPLL
jgi:hypothetical protein